MKTKELIRLLQKEDPSGEEDVCVNNIDIFFVEKLPAYYDGAAQVLIRDDSKKPYYDVVGGKYKRIGWKIQIHTLSISDVIEDTCCENIDYSELASDQVQKTKDAHSQLRTFVKEVENKIECDNFVLWAKKKASLLTEDLETMERIAKQFFEDNLNRSDPIPTDIPVLGYSYTTRRWAQWDREIDVYMDQGYLYIKKHEN